jgi:hypothetical protein
VASSDGVKGEGKRRGQRRGWCAGECRPSSFQVLFNRRYPGGRFGCKESPVRSSNIERRRHRSQVERRGRLVGDPSFHALNAVSLVSTLDMTAEKAYVEDRIFEENVEAKVQLQLWQGGCLLGPTAWGSHNLESRRGVSYRCSTFSGFVGKWWRMIGWATRRNDDRSMDCNHTSSGSRFRTARVLFGQGSHGPINRMS